VHASKAREQLGQDVGALTLQMISMAAALLPKVSASTGDTYELEIIPGACDIRKVPMASESLAKKEQEFMRVV